MALPLTKTGRPKSKRVLISGKQGVGKSTAIKFLTRNPLILDWERKLPPEMEGIGQTWDYKGRMNFHYIKQGLIDLLNEPKLDCDSIVCDSLSKLEEFCESHAIEQDYKGVRDKYSSFQTGPKNELPQYFAELLDFLGRIQDKHNVDILCIGHAKEKLYNNVMGKDYYKWMLDLKDAPQARALKWFDYIGFVYDDVQVDSEGLRSKGEKQVRYISFDNSSPLFDAKSLKPLPARLPFDREGKWVETVFAKEIVK